MIVRFVSISGIVDHHFLIFLSIIDEKKNTREGCPFIKLDNYTQDGMYYFIPHPPPIKTNFISLSTTTIHTYSTDTKLWNKPT